MSKHSITRSAARLGAVQALYQHDMDGTPTARLIHEFHEHRLGAIIEDMEYAPSDIDFFDDLVGGTIARLADVDAAITGKLADGWTMARLEKAMKATLRVGTYELIARPDVPVAATVSEYVDVAKAFHDQREAGFVNGLLDAIAKDVRR